MKICETCQATYADDANFCVTCGEALVKEVEVPGRKNKKTEQWQLFWLTLGGSLLLSWTLIVVFHLPVFILGAVLPLIWWRSKSS